MDIKAPTLLSAYWRRRCLHNCPTTQGVRTQGTTESTKLSD